MAFELVAAAPSIEKIDVSRVTDVLYLMRVSSDRLWPPQEHPLDGSGGVGARELADDLGFLASLPTLSVDSRGFPYLALHRLAEAGVTHAFDVLRACLRWEWAADLVVLVADALAKYPEHRSRDEAVLTLLKSENLHDSWPLDLLGSCDGAVRLRHHSRRLTASHLTAALSPLKRNHELTTQMELAVRDRAVSRVEVVLRDAIEASGIEDSYSNFIRMKADAPFSAPLILPALIAKCIREWPDEHRIRLWILPFELIVFGPLNALRHTYGENCGASSAIDSYISALESPVSEHEVLVRTIAGRAAEHPLVELAICELQIRRSTIRALRNGAIVKQDGETLDIRVYPANYNGQLSRARSVREHLRRASSDGACVSIGGEQSTEMDRVLQIAWRVVEAWDGIPDC